MPDSLSDMSNIHVFLEGGVPWDAMEAIRPGVREKYEQELLLPYIMKNPPERNYILLQLTAGWDKSYAAVLTCKGREPEEGYIMQVMADLGHTVRNLCYRQPKGVAFYAGGDGAYEGILESCARRAFASTPHAFYEVIRDFPAGILCQRACKAAGKYGMGWLKGAVNGEVGLPEDLSMNEAKAALAVALRGNAQGAA